MAHLLIRLIDAQARWAKPLGEFNHRWLGAILRPLGPVKDLLHGRWLGHPLHAVLTDVPIGILLLVIVLDVGGQRDAADIALVVGILAMLGSAVTGAADYVDTDGTARTRATVHASLMVVALGLYLGSLAVRAAGGDDRTLAVAISALAFVVLAAGAYVGGDLVFVLGNMVSRHAFRGRGTKWIALQVADDADPARIPEATPVKARLGINDLVLVRNGSTVQGLHAVCSHAGGPLAEGRVEDGCLVCPWHGSRFRLGDGRASRGPAVHDQPAYEVRLGAAGWEARRRPD
jgi:nitrite reductase/ring-hydroxylating ferredoxin subunit